MASSLCFQTTFLVPNLHCPSCVVNIESALYKLKPKPVTISHSIVSHTVTVTHLPSLPIALLCMALEEAGYDIDSVHPDPRSDEVLSFDDFSYNSPLSEAFGSATWTFPGFGGSVKAQEDEPKKRKRHMENCALCRDRGHLASDGKVSVKEMAKDVSFDSHRSGLEDTYDNRNDYSTVDEEKSIRAGDVEHELIAARPEPIAKVMQAEFSVGGMTCSSCTNSITAALRDLSWIHNVVVNLITHSASVSFNADHQAEEVVQIIEDAGFEAMVQQVNEFTRDTKKTKLTEDSWKATYAIGGMTCSSCSAAITKALQNFSWIKKVNINLVGNSATVIFDGRHRAEQILETIEDIGYDAKLDEVVSLTSEIQEQTQRKVAVQINGMYCEHCPSKIEHALVTLGKNINIEKMPTPDRSILNIKYIPQPPAITIRSILDAIRAADSAFEPSIFHPLTIEERSRMMQQRGQRHLLTRLALTVLTAIPTFIIGIVYMNLIPSNDKSREYLMAKLGGVARAQWALFVMATAVYFFAADMFHRRTLKELRALWRPGSPVPLVRRFVRFGSMNMLVSLGTTVAYVSSIAILIVSATEQAIDHDNNNDFYFDSVVFLTMFLLIGRFMEAYSKAKTGDAVASLGQLRPSEALLVEQVRSIDGEKLAVTVRSVPVDLLEMGDIVKIQHGSSPPCDGLIVEGSTKFDESSLTGEARPIDKAVGDSIFAGTLNQGSAISIRVTGVAGTSMLDQIVKVVREGQTRRAPVERLADSITGHFVPMVTLIAVLTWLVWLALGLSGTLPDDYLDTDIGGWPYWSLQFAIAVFVVACPCGIGLAAPTALFVGGGLAAKHGILVKGGGEAFQEASQLDCIVFDKTGTLTEGGEPKVTDFELATDMDWSQLLGMMKRLEEDSSHPVAKAITSYCQDHDTSDVLLKDTVEIPGKGMRGTFEIRNRTTSSSSSSSCVEMLIGNEALMTDFSVDIPARTTSMLKDWKSAAKSVVLAATRTRQTQCQSQSWSLSATLSVSDPIRPEAPAVIKALQQRHVNVWMLSGDNRDTAHAVGKQLGIPVDNIIAGVLPEHKADKIKYLQRTLPSRYNQRRNSINRNGNGNGKNKASSRAIIAMVGDGINDSPALATADVSIAIGSGSDVAISTASFILVTSRLTAILTLLDLSRAVFRRVRFNFAWALVYNMVGLPVAAGVLYPLRSGGGGGGHVRLDPVWAALAMALSSVSVVASSLALRTRVPVVGFRAAKVNEE